jgi:hypothetical protein
MKFNVEGIFWLAGQLLFIEPFRVNSGSAAVLCVEATVFLLVNDLGVQHV